MFLCYTFWGIKQKWMGSNLQIIVLSFLLWLLIVSNNCLLFLIRPGYKQIFIELSWVRGVDNFCFQYILRIKVLQLRTYLYVLTFTIQGYGQRIWLICLQFWYKKTSTVKLCDSEVTAITNKHNLSFLVPNDNFTT